MAQARKRPKKTSSNIPSWEANDDIPEEDARQEPAPNAVDSATNSQSANSPIQEDKHENISVAADPVATDSSSNVAELDTAGTPTSLKQMLLQSSLGCDTAAKIDHLGFAPYVIAVAEFLTDINTRPPLTMSIEGEWGSGKSSFMEQLELEITKKSPTPICIKFNAWRHDKEDALWAAFAVEFLNQIKKSVPKRARIAGNVRVFIHRFSWREGWQEILKAILWLVAAGFILYGMFALGTAEMSKLVVIDNKPVTVDSWFIDLIKTGSFAGGLALVVLLLSKFQALIGNPFAINLNKYLNAPDYSSRIAFIEKFHADFNRIICGYLRPKTAKEKAEAKVFVFIDDLDRCEVPKAADLMQAINLLISNDPRLIFVIGMDREKIAAGLAVKYEKLIKYLPGQASNSSDQKKDADDGSVSKGLEFGWNFIEKFIQIPFTVPRADAAGIRTMLTTMAGEAAELKAASTAQETPPPISTPLGATNPGSVTPPGASGTSQPPSEMATTAIDPVLAQRRQEASDVLFRFGNDSDFIRKIALELAPTLEYNPRRIKQFINLFRLRAVTAQMTGLMRPIENPKSKALSFELLGKYVAISLKWPLLISDIQERPDLILVLEALCLKEVPAGTIYPPAIRFAYWQAQAELMTLLSLGSHDEPAAYRFADFDITRLLQVAPQVMPFHAFRAPFSTGATPREPESNNEASSQALQSGSSTTSTALDQGRTLFASGHLDLALLKYEVALKAAKGRGSILEEALVLTELGDVEAARSNMWLARQHYLQAHALYNRLGNNDRMQEVAKRISGLGPDAQSSA